MIYVIEGDDHEQRVVDAASEAAALDAVGGGWLSAAHASKITARVVKLHNGQTAYVFPSGRTVTEDAWHAVEEAMRAAILADEAVLLAGK